MPTQTLIKTNKNSRTARAARSSLVCQSPKVARKDVLDSICAQIDDKYHRFHKGRG